GAGTAKSMCEKAGIKTGEKPKHTTHEQAEKLFKAMREVKVIAPPTDCLSPIGEALLEKGLKKEISAEFYVTASRSPVVYRGFPFLIEVGIAYGGQLDKEGQIKLMRFANRVPLLYQQGACAITEAVTDTNWKPYGLSQSGSNLPSGPAIIVVHMASVWVPFTSEAKDAIAHYDEIIKEIKLALQECGRKLNAYINKHVKAQEYQERINLFEKYIPEVAGSIAKLSNEKKTAIEEKLYRILKKERSSLENNGENGKGK
ncbi:MAG: DNA topoisomerase VI subunit B, partial [Nanoarchaeota archaeon]